MRPIFFSHSSSDAVAVGRIKERLKDLIGESAHIFLSSDGESIPFGKRWLAEIEGALKGAKLMFAFCSENSVKSSWVLFEIGHASGRKVKVIPVGLPGFDIGRLPAPVNALQGFSIRDYRGLNNLIEEINRINRSAHSAKFAESDFDKIFEGYRPANHLSLAVDTITFSIQDHIRGDLDEAISETARVFKIHQYPGQVSAPDTFQSHGFRLINQTGVTPRNLLLQVTPAFLLADGPGQIDLMVRGLRTWGFQGLRFNLNLAEGYEVHSPDIGRVSSKVAHAGVSFDETRGLQSDQLRFEVPQARVVVGSFKSDNINALAVLNDLVRLLVENEVITPARY